MADPVTRSATSYKDSIKSPGNLASTFPAFVPMLAAEQPLLGHLKGADRAPETDRAARKLMFLLSSSRQLAACATAADVLRSLVEQVVPELGDAAVVHLAQAGRLGRRAATTTARPLGDDLPEWWDSIDDIIRGNAAYSGQPRLMTTASTVRRLSASAQGRLRKLVYLSVPLRAAGRTLGMLTLLADARTRRYQPDDLALAEALGDQAGLALERAGLRQAEQRRIANELHDRVQQTLFAIGLTAAAALQEADAETRKRSLTDALIRVCDLSHQGVEQLRSAIFDLNHSDYAGPGLTRALWKLVRSFQQRTGLHSDLLLAGSQRPLTTDISETLYATAREALANVERHARAAAVVLRLQFGSRAVTLTIHDDGNTGASCLVMQGISSSTMHHGLRGLRERVQDLQGTFSARSAAEGGFVVRARIPLASESWA